MTVQNGWRRVARRLAVPGLALVVVVALYTPSAFGFSAGITRDDAGVEDWAEIGCASCHGQNHEFARGAERFINWTITDEEAEEPLAGNVYDPDTTYRIRISFEEQVVNSDPGANRAGFNLRVSAGALEPVEDMSQVSDDGMEATHVDASRVEWEVLWTSPPSGVAVFDLFVNDVDGAGRPTVYDKVFRLGWFLMDDTHTLPGEAVDEEIHVGVPLPQYWIGLLAVAGMLVIILFSFVYMRYMSPHHKDQKDR